MKTQICKKCGWDMIDGECITCGTLTYDDYSEDSDPDSPEITI